jgi:dTDP-4-dehydrorhamnose reductase
MDSNKPLVVVTGRSGQLGWELMRLSEFVPEYQYFFTGRNEIDLSEPASIAPFFERYKPSVFVNCAAYTAVDKAETEKELALCINATAVAEIARCCKLYGCKLITISTDYVFNGMATTPYRIDEPTDPVNYYGYTKMLGEQMALEQLPSSIIIRTSWVYSEHGHNFVKTMLRLMRERESIGVVNDQQGCPTSAADLAKAILQIIQHVLEGTGHKGVYHFSNQGAITWYDFALAIRNLAGLTCEVKPIPSSAFPTPAKRPQYSVMDITAIADDFGITLRNWQESLQECMGRIEH